MSWESIQAAAAVGAGAGSAGLATAAASEPAAIGGAQVDGFGRLVSAGIGEVNAQLLSSQVDMQRLAVGDVQNLHQVMMHLEESRLSFQLMLQVRNRLLEAYQDIMKMQV